MRADNWAICPRCKWRAQVDIAREESNVADKYGKITARAFLAAAEAIRKRREQFETGESVKCTFREDYEVGVDEVGEFSVSYSGCCTACGLSHEYKYTEELKLVTVPNVKEKRP